MSQSKCKKIYKALTDVNDDFIEEMQEAITESRSIKRKPRIRLFPIAACLIMILLTVTARAEMVSGYVSNLLAPLYGGAQTELADHIGVPVDASATVGDYTLTADAVIGDRNNIAVVYALTRNDGGLIPEGTHFEEHSNSIWRNTGGGSIHYELNEDGTKLQIVEKWTCSSSLFQIRNTDVIFSNLIIYEGPDKADTPLCGGSWELKFTIREDTTIKIPVNDREVIGSAGNQYQIHEILISPIGVHMELTAPNSHINGVTNTPIMPDFSVSVVLSDDTIIELKDATRGGGGNLEDATFNADYGSMYEQPIQLENIKALIICDTTFPVDLLQ